MLNICFTLAFKDVAWIWKKRTPPLLSFGVIEKEVKLVYSLGEGKALQHIFVPGMRCTKNWRTTWFHWWSPVTHHSSSWSSSNMETRNKGPRFSRYNRPINPTKRTSPSMSPRNLYFCRITFTDKMFSVLNVFVIFRHLIISKQFFRGFTWLDLFKSSFLKFLTLTIF